MDKQIEKSIDEVCDKHLSKDISKALRDGEFTLVEDAGVTVEKIKLPFGILIKKLSIAKSTAAITIAFIVTAVAIMLYIYL